VFSALPAFICVQIANGTRLICSTELHNATWYLNDYQFTSTLKVLPLSSYDMIVGLDWLQLHSPMLIHWTDKWLTVPYQGTTVKLVGLQPRSTQC
jgi:hypothetical protein